MKRVMVRYTVKADRAAENERYISRVYEQLRRESPAGLRYATFKLEDGVTFVHIALIDDGDGNPLGELEAFRDFTSQIEDRIVLNAYFPLGHGPGGFRSWWRQLHDGSDELLDNPHLMPMAGRFARRLPR